MDNEIQPEELLCKRCETMMSIPDDLEPTEYCNLCAQELVQEQAEQIEHLKRVAADAIGGPVSDFELLLGCERQAQQKVREQAKQIKFYQSQVCEAHDPQVDGPGNPPNITTCPYCECVHLAEQIKAKDVDIERLKEKVGLLHDACEGEYWAWIGDGHDHPESLVCSVVMRPEKLRELLEQIRVKDEAISLANERLEKQ